jgi:phosphoglycolate/pyridoxal phosphate phosphatase family enzyme
VPSTPAAPGGPTTVVRWRAMDGLLCDLDGVVYRGDVPVPGAVAALSRLRARGTAIVLCTNNSTATTSEYVAKLAHMGLEVSEGEILTSATVTAEVLAMRGMAGGAALVIGERGLRESIARVGLKSTAEHDDLADVVVVGLDRSFDYAAMRRAQRALEQGAAFVATNDDATLPVADGGAWPGAGAILASLEVASGRRAEVMGKPNAPMMDAAERRLRGARDIVVVGDRPETDLRGGALKGWRTVLVLSGVTSPDQAAKLDPAPDAVIESLAELVG